MIVKAPAMQVNNIFTVNFIFCPLKANTVLGNLKTWLAIETSQNNA